MKVFISGATGVLGKRVVRLLVASGQKVIGLSRSEANTKWLSKHGAEARQGDLFEAGQMCDLTHDCGAILHLATAIPTGVRTSLADWETNDRIRRDGTQALVEAALKNGCKLYLQESITAIYGDRSGEWVDESSEIKPQPGTMLQSAIDMEGLIQSAVNEQGLPAIVLRFGQFYSHDAAHTRMMFEMVRKGLYPVIGDGSSYWNMIHVDDAAGAVVKAVENSDKAIAHTFNVCDNEPATPRRLLDYVARTLNARRPLSIPVALAKLAIGASTVDYLRSSVRVRNQQAKEKLAWQPVYLNYRDGFRAAIKKWQKNTGGMMGFPG